MSLCRAPRFFAGAARLIRPRACHLYVYTEPLVKKRGAREDKKQDLTGFLQPIRSYRFANQCVDVIVRNHQLTDLRLKTYGIKDLRTYQLTDLPTYGLTNLPTYQLTDLPTYRLTDLRTYRLTDLPTYGLTDLPTYQLTDSRLPNSPTHHYRLGNHPRSREKLHKVNSTHQVRHIHLHRTTYD